MKIGGVFSGGGSKGGFIVGYVLGMATRGIYFDAVTGVSVGALVAAMIAQNKLSECVEIFKTVRAEDVHHKYSIPSVVYRILVEKRRGLYNARGLRSMVEKHIDKERMVIPCYAGFVSLHDGQYYGLSQVDYDDTENFAKAILASALMPVIWEDVPEIKLKDGRVIRHNVDGGIRNNTPLADIIQEQPDKIYIIQCSNGEYEAKEMHTFFDNSKRTLDIILDEIVRNDTESLLNLNKIVQAEKLKNNEVINPSNGKPYKCYEAVVVQPRESLGDNLDFSEDIMLWRFNMGYQQALRDHPIQLNGI